MGEKGMDTGGMSDHVASAPAGHEADLAAMGTPLENSGPPNQPQPQSSGPNVGEVVEDVVDPLGIHKLFQKLFG